MSIDTRQFPKQIGPYKLHKKLGEGGMGTVFLAEHTELGRQVALKVLSEKATQHQVLFDRFRREAKSAATMPPHPNIVILYDHGEQQGFHYLAFELVKGSDLSDVIKAKGTLSPAFALDVVKQVARALDHAHKHGYVHRDIKPSNLLIDQNKVVKLADMGLARNVEELHDPQLTSDGMTVGTVDYMAPEQAKDSHSADIRSDIYALGCTWYHMLTGEPPFPKGSAMDRLMKHLTEKAPDVRAKNSKVSEDMSLVIERMMAKNQADRYQNPRELLAALAELDPRARPAAADVSALKLLAEEEGAGRDSATRPKPAARRAERVAPPPPPARAPEARPVKAGRPAPLPRTRGTAPMPAQGANALTVPCSETNTQQATAQESGPENPQWKPKPVDPVWAILGVLGIGAIFGGVLLFNAQGSKSGSMKKSVDPAPQPVAQTEQKKEEKTAAVRKDQDEVPEPVVKKAPKELDARAERSASFQDLLKSTATSSETPAEPEKAEANKTAPAPPAKRPARRS